MDESFATGENDRIFVGEILVDLDLVAKEKYSDNDDNEEKAIEFGNSITIDGCLYLKTIRWNKNDFVCTKILLTSKSVDIKFGTTFSWKFHRLLAFRHDMRDAHVEINVCFGENSNDMGQIENEIKCTILWQKIRTAPMFHGATVMTMTNN